MNKKAYQSVVPGQTIWMVYNDKAFSTKVIGKSYRGFYYKLPPTKQENIFEGEQHPTYDPQTLKYAFTDDRDKYKNLCFYETCDYCFFTKKEAIMSNLKGHLSWEKYTLGQNRKELTEAQEKVAKIQVSIYERETEIKDLTEKIAKIK